MATKQITVAKRTSVKISMSVKRKNAVTEMQSVTTLKEATPVNAPVVTMEMENIARETNANVTKNVARMPNASTTKLAEAGAVNAKKVTSEMEKLAPKLRILIPVKIPNALKMHSVRKRATGVFANASRASGEMGMSALTLMNVSITHLFARIPFA